MFQCFMEGSWVSCNPVLAVFNVACGVWDIYWCHPDFPVKLIVCIFYQTSRRSRMIYTQNYNWSFATNFQSVSQADLQFFWGEGYGKVSQADLLFFWGEQYGKVWGCIENHNIHGSYQQIPLWSSPPFPQRLSLVTRRTFLIFSEANRFVFSIHSRNNNKVEAYDQRSLIVANPRGPSGPCFCYSGSARSPRYDESKACKTGIFVIGFLALETSPRQNWYFVNQSCGKFSIYICRKGWMGPWKKKTLSKNMALGLAALCFRVKFLEPMPSKVSPQVVPFWGRDDGGWNIFLFCRLWGLSDLALSRRCQIYHVNAYVGVVRMQWYFEGRTFVWDMRLVEVQHTKIPRIWTLRFQFSMLRETLISYNIIPQKYSKC